MIEAGQEMGREALREWRESGYRGFGSKEGKAWGGGDRGSGKKALEENGSCDFGCRTEDLESALGQVIGESSRFLSRDED